MTEEIIIPSSPADIQKLKNLVIEVSNCKTRIQAEKDLIKDIKERAKDELGIGAKSFNGLCKAHYEQSLNEQVSAVQNVADLYEAIFGVDPE